MRGVFGKGSLEEAMKECRYYNNIIHSSDEGEREIKIWSREYNLGLATLA